MAIGSLSAESGAEFADAGGGSEPVTSEPDKTPDAFLLAASDMSGSVPELMAKLPGGLTSVCRTAGADAWAAAGFCSASAPEPGTITVFGMFVVFASDDLPGADGCFPGSDGVNGIGEPGDGSVKTRGVSVGVCGD